MSAEKMRTFRAVHDKDNPYFMMRRDTAQDKTLSYECVGMLAYILSKPDDWEIMPGDLERDQCGRDKTYRVLKDLIQRRYVKRVGLRQRGKFVSIEYEVYEQPYTEKPDTAKPDTENPTPQSKEGNKRKKRTTSPSGDDGKPKFSKAQLDEVYEAVKAAWTTDVNGSIVNYRGMLFGMGTVRGEWKKFTLTQPLTLDELERFTPRAKARMKAEKGEERLPKTPQVIAEWVEDLRAGRMEKYAPQQTAPKAESSVTDDMIDPTFMSLDGVS